jgi:starch phosphorylase
LYPPALTQHGRQETNMAKNSSDPNDVHLYDWRGQITAEMIRDRLLGHVKYTCYKDWRTATPFDKLMALSHLSRDLAASRNIATHRTYLERDVKRAYYLSMEFLIGQLLRHNLLALGVLEETRQALRLLDLDLDELCNLEPDAGLGNGGLGRLAACFLESMAAMELPGYGYGLRYEHGMFKQEFEDGWQIEKPDDWLKYGTPWEVVRPEFTVPVLLYGRVVPASGRGGRTRPEWVDWQMIEGVPHDIGVVGYGCNTVNLLRLWASRASEGFRIDVFNRGEYVKAVESENWAETVTKVLYPSDSVYAGKELRLIQEYFLCTCALRDILRRYQKNHGDWCMFPRKNAIHLNDTHPALAIVELMRHLIDEARLPWETAWDITSRTFAYTNHTLLPEALERWPVELLQRVLPRHMQIIFDINAKVLHQVEVRHPGDADRLRDVSLIEEGPHQQVRMAHLAIMGSHSVNGVSALHSALLRRNLAPQFVDLWPERFNNKTNGINHRRWLLLCNPGLAEAVTRRIGAGWITNLEELRRLEPLADDAGFQAEFRAVKRHNKERLAGIVRTLTGENIDPDSLFDVQVKRLHEYKRQLLNVMHIIALFHRVKTRPGLEIVPRTFIFGAKAAPSYHLAKRIIKLANEVAGTVNNDPDVDGRIKVVFIPDYRVSLAESIIPAADLSEQISTAGTEASGTGNMKLALNGALTIGTWDGATIEIVEAVGRENIFIFGHRAEDLQALRASGEYDPARVAAGDPELAAVIETIRHNEFNPMMGDLFTDVYQALIDHGDHYFHGADFRSYVDAQDRVSDLYRRPDAWSRAAILNVARMGWFSSDRAVRQYAEEVWKLERAPIPLPNGD